MALAIADGATFSFSAACAIDRHSMASMK